MKTKKFILIYLIANLFLSWINIASAQTEFTTGGDYSKSGVDSGIKKYLCAPTEAPASSQTYIPRDAQGNLLPSFAGGTSGQQLSYNSGANNPAKNDLYTCINKIYKFAIVIASVIAVLMIVIAGYYYINSGGDEEAVQKAKSILTSSLTSLVILFIGYILLKQLNPDLISFRSVQPPSVKQDTTACPPPSKLTIDPSTGGNRCFLDNGTIAPPPGGASNTVAADLTGSGCAFQTDKQKNEAYEMSPALVTIVKKICFNIVKLNNGTTYPGTQGSPPTISSVIGAGQHATNSYHYKGCAVDFAAGNSNFINSPIGKAIIQEAKNAGISTSRINPGTDATRTDMVHIDLGTSCPKGTGI